MYIYKSVRYQNLSALIFSIHALQTTTKEAKK